MTDGNRLAMTHVFSPRLGHGAGYTAHSSYSFKQRGRRFAKRVKHTRFAFTRTMADVTPDLIACQCIKNRYYANYAVRGLQWLCGSAPSG